MVDSHCCGGEKLQHILHGALADVVPSSMDDHLEGLMNVDELNLIS